MGSLDFSGPPRLAPRNLYRGSSSSEVAIIALFQFQCVEQQLQAQTNRHTIVTKLAEVSATAQPALSRREGFKVKQYDKGTVQDLDS